MEIKIEVSDEKFSKFFGDDIEQYITEDLKKEIVKNAIIDFCTSEIFRNKIERLFFERGDYSNNYQTKLTEYGEYILSEAIKNNKDLLDPAKQKLNELFDKNGEDILIKAFSKMIISSLFNTTDFQTRVQEAAENIAITTSNIIMNDHINKEH